MRDFDTADDVREVLMQDWGVAIDDDVRLWWVGPRNDARLAKFGLALPRARPSLALERGRASRLLRLARAALLVASCAPSCGDTRGRAPRALNSSSCASCAAQGVAMREGARTRVATMLREATEKTAGATQALVRRDLEGIGLQLRALGTACPSPRPFAEARTIRCSVLPTRGASACLCLALVAGWPCFLLSAGLAFCGACSVQ